jgi:DNA-binding transcriptional MerR regulator
MSVRVYPRDVRVGEVAERAGVNVETLRDYERRGLLPEPRRSPGGHRDYDEDAVRFVRAVKEAQTLGFSLSEIAEYATLTRRAPRHASEAVRTRLVGKLGQIDEKTAALQRMRAGILRALDERWQSVERSTSNAAYLARAGRDPILRPGEPLHVTNGESAASTMRESALEGVVLSWDDVLHVGPLAGDAAESRRLRAAFLAETGWGEADAIETDLQRRDDLLARADRVALWFEHDLVDQLQLLQVLSQLPATTAVELVQTDEHLGGMTARQLEAAWPRRVPLDASTRAAARDAWRGVVSEDLDQDVPALPFLRSALRRLAEERETPSRTKRQLLAALADGPKTALQLFFANQAREEAIFLGDSWAFLFLYELWQDGELRRVGGGPMPLPPPRGDTAAFASMMLEAR